MSIAVRPGPQRPGGPRSRGRSGVGGLRIALSTGLVVLLLAGIVLERELRHGEACASAALVRLTGLSASCVGEAAVYRIDGRLVGHSVTVGCTALMMLPPFVAVCSWLLLIRRVSIARPLLALLVAVGLVFAVNQLRLLTISVGMRLWGVQDGYAYTHILIGTLISTVGVVLAALVSLRILLGRRAPREAL